MTTSRIEELKLAIQRIGRPALSFAGFRGLHRSVEAAKEWDASHPEAAALYHALVIELDVEEVKAERENAARLQFERASRTFSAKIERSGIGQRALEAVTNARDTGSLQAVKSFLADKSKTWLILSGPTDSGKSVAAAWAVREAIRQGSDGAFRRASDIAKLSSFETGAAELEHLKRVAILALDDFGTENFTGHAQAQLHELLDYRHEFYGRIIITSNLLWKPAEGDRLVDRLGERLVDRIAQAGTVVQVKAESLRRRKEPV